MCEIGTEPDEKPSSFPYVRIPLALNRVSLGFLFNAVEKVGMTVYSESPEIGETLSVNLYLLGEKYFFTNGAALRIGIECLDNLGSAIEPSVKGRNSSGFS